MPIINVKLKVYGLWSYYESNNLYMKFKQLTIFTGLIYLNISLFLFL